MNIFFSIILSALFAYESHSIDAGNLNERHQAMYLVNLVRNIDWSQEKIMIGVVGESLVTAELETLVKKNLKISVRTLEDISSVTECQVVYLPNATNKSFFTTQQEIGDAPVLLVVDKRELVARGAEMGFYTEDDKLKIVMNPSAIEETGIKVSHSLMEKAALN
ncbi:MAG: YfiR family protein [Cyclobacteriaceae bacterium]